MKIRRMAILSPCIISSCREEQHVKCGDENYDYYNENFKGM